MRNFVATLAVLGTTLSAGTALMAEDMSQTDIAKKYYLALYSGDKDTVRELAASNMAFQDPTAPAAYGVPTLNELEPVFDIFAGFSGGGITVDFTNAYASNDQVVLAVELSGTVPAAALGMEEGIFSLETNGVTVLQISEGKVVSHTDYMNYSRFEGSIKPVE